VGVDDVMPEVLWKLYFLEAQGYEIDDKVLYQDNKRSILLETNGRGSSGKRTRHIVLIPQVRPAHKYPISPWEMIHPPGGDNAVCR
jgi:hypothetical protein